MCQQLRKVKARAHVQDSLNFQWGKLSDFFFSCTYKGLFFLMQDRLQAVRFYNS